VTNSKIEHLFSYTVSLKMPPEVIGPVAEGIRVNFYLAGGEIRGPRCAGKVLPVGADWLLIRKDGIGLVDVRATMEMHDGALVYSAYTGVLDPGPNGYEAFVNGTLPPKFPIRTAPRFQTAAPAYAWMNRVQAYGVGEVDLANALVSYDVYAAL
jgi:imidazole glycerol phosphate synthase subunit HisF